MSWRANHRAAVRDGAEHYLDPDTGYRVFTELHHRARGICCGMGCRHCPYQHARVPAARREGLAPPVVLAE